MLIHCTMEELLGIRDGRGSPAALRHIDACEECMEELERLHQRIAALKALPTMNAPRDRWDVVRRRVLADRSRKRRIVATWISVAAAASMVAAAGLSRMPVFQGTGQSDHYARLVRESDELEAMLRTVGPQVRVVSGREASAIAEMEDELSVLDARLARAQLVRRPMGEMIPLMRQRIELMDALVGIHTAKSTLVGF